MPVDDCQRIFNFLMRIFREGTDNFYALAGDRIRAVHDPQRRFAALNQGQRAAHVFRRSQLRRQRLPGPQFLQRFFRIDAGWHVRRVANGQTTAFQQAGPVGFIINADIALSAGLRRHDHQAVAEQRRAGCGINAFFLHRVIHPFLVGGDKQIRRRARFNLSRQGR
ncbi:Uncharacterised protein [Klebsiella pneumoniae]|nr:Uncharacterised protein [Klebsiella pneumoniae]